MIRYILIATLLAASQSASPQHVLTPRDSFLDSLKKARGIPTHQLWFYISGLTNGANIASIYLTGEPLICDAHEFAETDKTEEVIMRWLIKNDQLANPDITLEMATGLAFADSYPCNKL
jgi:hypothetical protein